MQPQVGPTPLLFDPEHRPITTPKAWLARRADLKAAWKSFLGSIRHPPAVPPLKVIEEDRPGDVVRQLVRYETEPDLQVEAYLLRPAAPKRDRAGVVVLHSTVDHTIRQPAGIEGPTDLHIGLHLAQHGHVVICPRCFLWEYGRSGHLDEAVTWQRRRYPGVTGMAKMLADAVRAVDILAAQPDVNPKRIGAIGHSLGAKEALYLAAFDERIRSTVFSEGGIGLTFSNWEAPWYLGEAIRRTRFELDHGQVLALVAPRAFLLIGGDSADGEASRPYVDAVRPVWRLMGRPEAIDLLNHRQGHALPAPAQSRAYEWLDRFLRD